MKKAKPWGEDGPTIEVGEPDPKTGRVPVKLPPGLHRAGGSRTPFADMLREWQDEQKKTDR